MRVAFPLYALPQVQEDMRLLWAALRPHLPLEGLPQAPAFSDPLAAGDVPDDLLMLQYGGYPFVTEWFEELSPLACLHYDAPYCEGRRHRGVVVTGVHSRFDSLEQLRGKRAAIRGRDSNTGMNLLRHLLLPLVGEGDSFFSTVIETGTHTESLRAVAEGRAEVASVDCVSLAYIGDYLPELAAAVRVIGVTELCPAPPLFTRRDADADTRALLLAAWQAALADPAHAALLGRLRISGLSAVGAAELDRITLYQMEAEAAGYPELR